MNYNLSAIPLLPLRGTVVFPHVVTHLDVGREKSIKAVEAAMANDGLLVVITQRDSDNEAPDFDDLYEMGTLVKVQQILRLPGGFMRILIEGLERVRLVQLLTTEGFFLVSAELEPDVYDENLPLEAYKRHCRKKFEEWAKLTKVASDELFNRLRAIEDVSEMVDFIAGALLISNDSKQRLLDESDVEARLNKAIAVINVELQVAELENTLNNQVRQQMEKSQKEYFLHEKIKAIHDELGDSFNIETEIEEFRQKLENLELSEEVASRIEREITRLHRMPPMMPETTILRNYLELVLALPWKEKTEDRLDIRKAEEILDAEHFGLEKIKERILEFLSVRHLTKRQSGSILCFVGPPGVGKTSLASSIAKAMNRKFVRASLGGVRDEAEIRGHRRTYVGAMPGRMIQGLKSVGTKNPVYLLDEIDKLASDYKGDPSSALLEVLDPEQNNTFSDHFVEIPFDFSEVFWITTANVMSDIPKPLLDRMEVIQLSGYTEEEKLEIAKRYLVPKQIEKHGLTTGQIKISDAVLKRIIADYTREAGVRSLEKMIAKLCRKVARSIVEGQILRINLKNLHEVLGVPPYGESEREHRAQVGLACGLAWTSVGGVVLPCEAINLLGKGKLILTGSLGNVMKESAQAALTYIRKHAAKLQLDDDFYAKQDIHIHLPEGATPKDGPSAGITMTLAMVSALTNRKIRADIAMTGEITIRGQVLPIGGLKEKLLAAHRHGVKEVLIPKGNEKDLQDIPQSVKAALVITPVKTMDEVLTRALL